MAMTIKTEGISELNLMLAKLGSRAQDVASGALYDGAGVVADAFTRATESIQTEKFDYAPPGKTRLPSPEEKDALKRKTGIARFRKNGGEVDTMVGIGSGSGSGYVMMAGKRKAVRLIARSINSGTSFMKKQPVYRKAVSSCRKQAEAAIVSKAEQMFNQIINGK